jgi:PRC-barrel domain
MTFKALILGGAIVAFGAAMLSESAALAATQTRVAAAAPAGPTVPLDRVANATTSLMKLRVVDSSGEPIGTVTDVVTRADGKPMVVTVDASVSLGAHHSAVGIEAGKLGLDQGRHVLVARLTKAEIKAIPTWS